MMQDNLYFHAGLFRLRWSTWFCVFFWADDTSTTAHCLQIISFSGSPTDRPCFSPPPLLGHEGDPCLRSSDCSEGYCCARHFWTKICKPVLRQGEVCTKQRKKGSHGLEIFQRCDCAKGLSCKVWKDATSSSKSRLHMCQKIWSSRVGGSRSRRRGPLSPSDAEVLRDGLWLRWKGSKRQRLTRERTDCVSSSSLFGVRVGWFVMRLLWGVNPCTHTQTCSLTHTHARTRHRFVNELTDLFSHSCDIQGATC